MATIRAVCSSCNAQVDLRPSEIAAHVPSRNDDAGRYAFRCSQCRSFVVKAADDRVIGLLVAGGVEISDSTTAPWRDERDLHPEFPALDAPAFDLDDVIAFHELLEGDDWFDTLCDDLSVEECGCRDWADAA